MKSKSTYTLKCPEAWRAGGAEQPQVQSDRCIFMSGIILVCATAMQFVYGVQGHADWFSWSMFVYGSKRICLHMFHILGVFSFMCQQHHYTELLQSHLERPTVFCLFVLFIDTPTCFGLCSRN